LVEKQTVHSAESVYNSSLVKQVSMQMWNSSLIGQWAVASVILHVPVQQCSYL